MKKLLLILALVVAPAVRADEAKAKPIEAGKPIVVPFEQLPSGHMAVMVKVNGKGPYRLIFDTGAPITLMNNKIAKEADLLKGVKKPWFTLFGSMGDVKVKELEVGGQKVANSVAIVMDHPTVEAISKAFGGIDGIVGFPFFARFKMTLDYQAKTLTFVPNGYDPPDVLKSMQASLLATSGGEPLVLSASATWGLTVDKKHKDDDPGVTVTKLMADGPAAKAGLKEGDRLLTLGGRWTDSVADTFRAVGAIKAGTPIVAVIQRDGKEMKLTIKPIAGQ
jgi:hypothetical protein